MPDINTRIMLPLQDAIKVALSSVELKSKSVLHNIFYIVDKPGAGKTMCIGEEVKNRGWGFCPYSPALERLEKFGGIPDLVKVNTVDEYKVSKLFDDGMYRMVTETKENESLHTVWSVPQMITEINNMAKLYPYVVVLFDDWHLCDEDIQRIGFEVFTYYKLNNNPISQNVIFMLAGNESSAAGAKVQMSAIRNRTTLLFSKADKKYWLNNFAIPNKLHPVGISFFNNPMNDDLFQEEESTNEQFGSPRSWTSLFNLITFLEENDNLKVQDDDMNLVVSDNLIRSVVQGSVSRKAAERFMLHYELYHRVDLDKFFKSNIVDIPVGAVERYCYATAITYSFYAHYNKLIKDKKVDEKKVIGELYAKMITELKKCSRELSSTTLVNLGNISGNDKTGNISGLMLIADMIREDIISRDLVSEIKGINKLLTS